MLVQKTKKRNEKEFIKTWTFRTDTEYSTIKKRTQLIEKISLMQLHSIPPIKHEIRQNMVIQTMTNMQKQLRPIPPNKLIFNHLKTLAVDIDRMHQLGLVHGDIHPKNILFNGQTFILIDFEPYLQITEKGMSFYNVTPPWISHYDYTRKQLSFRTDRIGFFHTAYSMLYGRREVQNILWTFKQRKKQDYPIWDLISDAAIYRKNCQKILAQLIQNNTKSNLK